MFKLFFLGYLGYKFVIVGVATDPNPLNPSRCINANGTVMLSYSYRP